MIFWTFSDFRSSFIFHFWFSSRKTNRKWRRNEKNRAIFKAESSCRFESQGIGKNIKQKLSKLNFDNANFWSGENAPEGKKNTWEWDFYSGFEFTIPRKLPSYLSVVFFFDVENYPLGHVWKPPFLSLCMWMCVWVFFAPVSREPACFSRQPSSRTWPESPKMLDFRPSLRSNWWR